MKITKSYLLVLIFLFFLSPSSHASCSTDKCPEKIERWISSLRLEFPDENFNKLDGDGDRLEYILSCLFMDEIFVPIFGKSAWLHTEKEIKNLSKLVKKCDSEFIPGPEDELLLKFRINPKENERGYHNFPFMMIKVRGLDKKKQTYYNDLKTADNLTETLGTLGSLGYLLKLKKSIGLNYWKFLPSEFRKLNQQVDKSIETRLNNIIAYVQSISKIVTKRGLSSALDAWTKANNQLLSEYKSLTRDKDKDYKIPEMETLIEASTEAYNSIIGSGMDLELGKLEDIAREINYQDWKDRCNSINLLASTVSRVKSIANEDRNQEHSNYLLNSSDSIFLKVLNNVIEYERQDVSQLLTSSDPIVPLEELAQRKFSYENASRRIEALITIFETNLKAILKQVQAREEQAINILAKTEKPIVILDAVFKKRLTYNHTPQRALLEYSEIQNLITFFTRTFNQIEEQIISGNINQLYELALVYQNGSTKYYITKDPLKGREFLIMCAKRNHIEAQYLVGKSYITRESTRADLSQAAEWIYKSMIAGNKKAEALWAKHQLEKYL